MSEQVESDGVNSSGRQARVTVVDDEPTFCRSLMRFLTIAGFDVRTHTSGQAFLEQWGADPPDCLIVDVQMPGLSGFDVVERLRRSGGRMPVIMITASDDQSLQRRARAEGIDIFLLKPVDGESLLQEIRQAVARWRSAASERI